VPAPTDSDRSWFARHATLQHLSLKTNYFNLEAFVPHLLLQWGNLKQLALLEPLLAIVAMTSDDHEVAVWTYVT
ncbi:unnamed protein product, partial [Amoebophrya sp. A120]